MGIHYVLTNKFFSDDAEAVFVFLRQQGGRNDTTNALVAFNVITKILKTKIIGKKLSLKAITDDASQAPYFPVFNCENIDSNNLKDMKTLRMI